MSTPRISTIALALFLAAGTALLSLSGALAPPDVLAPSDALAMDGPTALALKAEGTEPPLPPDPAALWAYLQDAKYRFWGQFPDHRGVQKGVSPHGFLHQIFVRPGSGEAAHGLPYGSLVVKDNYNLKQVLTAVTVMYKVEGFNPEAGDWYWIKYAPDGKAQASGKLDGCIGCHRARADNDWIMVQDL